MPKATRSNRRTALRPPEPRFSVRVRPASVFCSAAVARAPVRQHASTPATVSQYSRMLYSLGVSRGSRGQNPSDLDRSSRGNVT